MPNCPLSGTPCSSNAQPSPVGSVIKPCPKAKGGIWVHVLDDVGNNIDGISTLKDGASSQATDRNGLSVYDPLDPGGPHAMSLAALTGAAADEYDPFSGSNPSVYVSDGQITYVSFELKRKMNTVTPEMIVDRDKLQLRFPDEAPVAVEAHVFRPEKNVSSDPIQVIKVTLTYKETLPAHAYDKGGVLSVSGVATSFWSDADRTAEVAAPGGSVTLTNSELKAGHTLYVLPEAAGQANLSFTLQDTTNDRVIVDKTPQIKSVAVESVNRITPYMSVEYLVVLRDAELWKEQRKNDTAAGSAAIDAALQIRPDPTRIELRAAQTATAPAYVGKGKLILTPANAKVFKDEACKTAFDTSIPIEFGQLGGGAPLTLYLQGATAGKFTAELRMDASNDPLIKVDDPAKGEMGCVELKLKLFHYKKDDVNKAVEPDVDDVTQYWNELKALVLDQTEMTAAERIGSGRMLHVQDNKRFGLAKLMIAKADATQWPDAAQNYKVVLDAANDDKQNKTHSGELKLFTLEKGGVEKALPMEMTLAQVKSAEQTLWVEGQTVSTAWRGRRLSIGIDRAAGGPVFAKKMDADWASFTVVKIKEVKCDVDNIGGQEAFVDASKVFINLDAQGRVLKSVPGKRKAVVTAEIQPALAGVDVYFSIVEHADNYGIATLPDQLKEKKLAKIKHTLKPVDKTDRKKLLHVSVKTDGTGKATIDTLQTPQLGKLKFKVGAYLLQDPRQATYIDQHTDLKAYAPALSSTWLEVWRRIFYKVAAVKRWSGASYLDRFDGPALQAQLAAAGIELKQVGASVTDAYVSAMNDYLAWSRGLLGGVAAARTMYLLLISGRGDKTDSIKTFNVPSIAPYIVMAGGKRVCTLILNAYIRFRSTTDQAKWLSSVSCTYDGHTTDISGVTTLTQTADFQFKVEIDMSFLWNHYETTVDAAKAQDSFDHGSIELKLIEADSSSGVSFHEAVVVCMDTREPHHANENAKDSATHTFLHEIGHYLGLAGKFYPDRADTSNPNFYSEQAGEVSAAGVGGMGLGPHCDGLTQQCIMWYQFKMTLAFCEMCQMHLRSRALHSPKVAARNKF